MVRGAGVAVGDTSDFTGLYGQQMHQDEVPADLIDDLAQLCQPLLLGTVT